MQVSLQALKAFESAARRGSFKLAAEELSLTPTAVSHHISNLESRLNVNLFHRQTRQIVLTETGRILAKATTEGFRKIDNALAEVKTAGSVVRVTTTSSFAAMLLIPALQGFSQAYPNIVVEVSTGETVDNQPYIIPIRYGDATSVAPGDIISHELFDVFGARGMEPPCWSAEPVTLFTTAWKNAALPAPPLAAWLAANGLDSANIVLKKFDQELFGIQQAMTETSLVFCSTTLTKRLLNANLLQQFGTLPVKSDLCYYVPDKPSFDSRNTHTFLNWIAGLLHR
ncbi:DNA-binding transcriptional LysR family regulator [Rheinheimera pacifica]|uniref:LysR family transcriptional regulator n=1 Tax=Rheinheimera pacifica TaxID=173990 RepID=UPI0028557E6D|nr:LysR family transcriptional regulator [Rheinheimera pacifica]MDR6982397.1 DNA-binding transcriptional LysR family regulator [Rheinheimera pacifica]